MAKATITIAQHSELNLLVVEVFPYGEGTFVDRMRLYKTLDHMVNGYPKHELPTAVDSPSRSPYAILIKEVTGWDEGSALPLHSAEMPMTNEQFKTYTHTGFELGAL